MTNIIQNTTATEMAVLSILLKTPAKIYEIDELKSEMFSALPNKNIFDNMKIISSNGNVPEFAYLVSVIKSRGMLNDCGGVTYLETLAKQDYDNVNLLEFVKMLVNNFKVRRLLTISAKIPNSIHYDNVDTIISSVRNDLDNLVSIYGGSGVSNVRDISELAYIQLVEKINKEKKLDITTGFSNLDGVVGGYIPEDLIIVAGRPSMGKTAFMCNSVLRGGFENVPSLIFSLEMSKSVLINRILAIKTGLPIFNIRFGIMNQKQVDLYVAGIDKIKNLSLFVDDTYKINISYIVNTIKKYHTLYNIKVVHIDYVQLLSERGEDSTHELGRISRELKLLARHLGITIVIYSQLNRLLELRQDKRPILSDLRQSGNLEEDADIVIFLYRDEIYHFSTKDKGVLELLIRKHRNGPVGVLFSSFNAETNEILSR